MASHPSAHAKRSPLTWKSRFLLIGFGLLLMLALLEAGLRVARTLQNPRLEEGWTAKQVSSGEHWAIYDPDLGYRQNPKFADMNPDGLRDHPIRPKNSWFRVLFLGDSVAVYGETVEDTFVGHLRGKLQGETSHRHVDVINAGIKGYTNYQEVLYLDKYGVKFQPDLVGFEFCLNDLFRFLHSFQVEDGRLVPGTYEFSTEAVEKVSESWWRRWAKRSYLLTWAYNNVPIARSAAEWRAGQGFSFDYRVDVRNAWREAPWLDVELQLRKAAELGRERGFGVFVVGFPIAVQYDPDYLARDREYVLKPQRKLREICDRLKIPFFDLYPEMKADYLEQDGIHLTPQGRRVAGERIADFLMGSKLLPRRP